MRFLIATLFLISTMHISRADLFTPAERAGVVTYWNAPGRHQVGARTDANRIGPFVVRLTPEASRWFFGYNRARGIGKVPPGEVPKPTTTQMEEWEKWVIAKLAYDRWIAGLAADAANAQSGIVAPAAATTTPATSPAPAATTPAPHPGPIPPALLALAGNPPSFATAVSPLRHIITFDDGDFYTYTEHVGVNQRYAYYRFAQGVVNYGTALGKMTDAELDPLFMESGMTPFEHHVAKAVSRLEGGFESVNTYDTGYLSVGFIQFATLEGGAGSLGEVLQREKADRPADYQNDFRKYGIDVNPAGAIVVVDPNTGAELAANAAVLKVIDDKRLLAVFQRAGARSRAFRIAQIKVAKSHYYPADDSLKVTVNNRTITGKVSDVIKSEAGMATLFDRKVNTGTIAALAPAVAKIMEDRKLNTLAEVVAHERELIKAMKYRHDFLQDQTLTQPK